MSRTLLLPAVAAAAAVFACSAPAADAPSPAPAVTSPLGAAAGAERWERHLDGAVSIDVPPSWNASREPGEPWLRLEDPDGNEAVVWPLLVKTGASVPAMPGLARTLVRRIWPDETWGAPSVTAGTVTLRAQKPDDEETAVAMLGWTTTPAGTAATLFAVNAADEDFARVAALARRAFETFRLAGGDGPAGADAASGGEPPAPRWVPFTDPSERAFTVEVPEGWPTEGGLFRFGAVDVRPGVETQSPDGTILVRLGEPAFGPFVTGAIGFAEGQVFSPGYGQSMTVRRYVPAEFFAEHYAGSRPGCGAPRVRARRARPDLAAEMNALYRQFGLAMALEAGEVAVDCGSDGGWTGYWLATLQVTQMGGPAMWKVEHLLGFLARPAQADRARAVLAHLAETLRFDPDWYARQTGLAANVSRIVTQTGQAIARTVSEGYQQRGVNEPRLSRDRSNAMLGVEQMVDEATGATYDVPAGWNHYWVSPQGTVVGTQIDAVPRVDLRALAPAPR